MRFLGLYSPNGRTSYRKILKRQESGLGFANRVASILYEIRRRSAYIIVTKYKKHAHSIYCNGMRLRDICICNHLGLLIYTAIKSKNNHIVSIWVITKTS